MLMYPFDLVSCSWPRHTQSETPNVDWTSPLMPTIPQASPEIIEGNLCWTINWQEFFRNNLFSHALMRNFYVIFQFRTQADGILTFTEANYHCIIRRAGTILHEPHTLQSPSLTTIAVKAGDLLEVAQWHETGEWTWSASLQLADQDTPAPMMQVQQFLQPYREQVQEAMRHPNGPPLKILTHGQAPIRTITAIYSLILNGYVPSQVYLFGDHQWPLSYQAFLKHHLPFAQIVPTAAVVAHVETLGATQLPRMVTDHWIILKTAISLLYPPHEFCMMDDDVFVLDRLDDALEAFSSHNLIFTTNMNREKEYMMIWRNIFKNELLPLATAQLNTGLYWLRNTRDPRELAPLLQQASISPQSQQDSPTLQIRLWEQGFIALNYADDCFALPSQRYYMPAIDGLPGGISSYDYLHNPSKFASIHFAGAVKPSDGASLRLLPQIIHQTVDGARIPFSF